MTDVAAEAPPVMTRSGDVVLRIDDISVTFTSRTGLRSKRVVNAVDGVTLELHRGETLGLVGESGSGKSSLVRAIFGINPLSAGSIAVLGRRIDSLGRGGRKQLLSRIQMVFQDPYSSLNPKLRVRDIIAEPLRITGVHPPEDQLIALLRDVGMDVDALDRRPSEFSGGQRQRIGIARALALRPEILVLDEPVSALDVSIQAQVINLLIDLQVEHSLSYLFIAHDLSVVRYIADRVAVMQKGRIVEAGPTERVFLAPEHPYTRSLLDAIPVPDPHARTLI